ncbi:MAG: hypothetical protein Q8O90_02415, partial [Elusimicrobiota bacterium]|nr:hypothetical protein [Elusimicrobiota bacterium]
ILAALELLARKPSPAARALAAGLMLSPRSLSDIKFFSAAAHNFKGIEILRRELTGNGTI